MCKRPPVSIATLLIATIPALAQTPPPAGPKFLPGASGDVAQLQDDRRRFLTAIYAISGPELDKVMQAISTQLPAQQAYQARNAKTVDRIDLAVAIVNGDSTLSEADRANRLARFNRQLNELHRKAPLSLSNVMRIAEGIVPSDKAAAARQRLLNAYGTEVKDAGGQLDPNKLDDLMVKFLPPKKRLDLPPPPQKEATPQATPVTVSPVPPPSPTSPPPPNQPTAQQTPPPTPAVATPPAPAPKSYPPAPPVADWEKSMRQVILKYRFSDSQKQVAEKIYMQCLDRAKQHTATAKADYEAAEKLSGEAKVKALEKLNQPINTCYGEMGERLEAVASIEQKQKAYDEAQKTKN